MAALGGTVHQATVLDLFAGSGALGLEALSRGAHDVTFVEIARGALRALRGNVESLEAGDRCRIVKSDAMAYLKGLDPARYDLVLADPPYDGGYATKLLERFAQEAFAEAIWVEHHTKETVPPLPGLRQRRYGDTTLSILSRVE